MSDALLRTGLIRLAHENPKFRPEILAVLKSAGCEKLPEGGMRDNCEEKKEEGKDSDKKASRRQAMEHASPEAMKQYLQEHPGADKSKHTVSKGGPDKGESSSTEKVVVKGGEALGGVLSQWATGGDLFGQVSSQMAAGKPVSRDKAEAAHKQLSTMLASPEKHRLEKSDIKDLTKVKNALEKSFSSGKKAGFPADSIGAPVPGGSAEGVSGKGTVSDAGKPWMKGEFTQQEFDELYEKQEDGELSDGVADSEPAKFAAERALRAGLIRLAKSDPSLREHLLPILGNAKRAAREKTAAGPDPKGRNWKQKEVSGIPHWIWEGSPGDTIQRFLVFAHEIPLGTIYKMTIKLADGALLQTYGQKTDKAMWFARAAQIYKDSQTASLDFSMTPEKWNRKLAGSNPDRLASAADWAAVFDTLDSAFPSFNTRKVTDWNKVYEQFRGKIKDAGAAAHWYSEYRAGRADRDFAIRELLSEGVRPPQVSA